MAHRIFITNDTPEFLEMMKDFLSMEGYTTQVADETTVQVDDIAQWEPDLLIVDILVRRAPFGWALINQIRQHPSLRTIPIIVCTVAHKEVQGREERLAAQGISILHKPFHLDDMITLIQQLLSS